LAAGVVASRVESGEEVGDLVDHPAVEWQGMMAESTHHHILGL
jgi:hypothetical protein